MNDSSLRITEPSKAPAPAQVEAWVGKSAYDLWTRVIKLIEKHYPNVFTPE